MFFILGNPRSGTTLLRLMLNAHPRITVPPECGFIQWLHSQYGNWTRDDARNPASTDRFLHDLGKAKKFETWKLNLSDLKRSIEVNEPENYAALCELVYQEYGIQSTKKPQLTGDKNNYYLHHIPLLLSIYPDARMILLVRDARDVAGSYKSLPQIQTDSFYKPELPATATEAAKDWLNNNIKIEDALSDLPASQKTRIRFEDLLTEPSVVLKQVCDFLGTAYDQQMLNYYLSPAEPAETLDWKMKTLGAPDTSVIGQYRQKLSTEEIRDIEKIAGSLLEKYGYR